MSITCPSRYGIVFRKSERTNKSVARLARWRAQAGFMVQDEHLVAFSVASNASDLQEECRTLREEGCVPRADYVLTSSEDGVMGPLPDWLCASAPAIAIERSEIDRSETSEPVYHAATRRSTLTFVGMRVGADTERRDLSTCAQATQPTTT